MSFGHKLDADYFSTVFFILKKHPFVGFISGTHSDKYKVLYLTDSKFDFSYSVLTFKRYE